MRREDHILWKLTETYDLLYRMRRKYKAGDLSWDEYAAVMEPRCIELMQMFLHAIETGTFLEWHRNNMEHYDKDSLDPYGNPRGSYGYPFDYTSEYVITNYNKLVETYRNAQTEADPNKRTHELVIGMDMFVGWMHGSFELSGKVMREYPITGDPKTDYDIALHTMYLVTCKLNADDAIKYLREKLPEEW
jgi:hypothetical protein